MTVMSFNGITPYSHSLGKFTSARSDPIYGGSYFCLLDEDKTSLEQRNKRNRAKSSPSLRFGSRLMHQTSEDSIYNPINRANTYRDGDVDMKKYKNGGDNWISTNRLTYGYHTNYTRNKVLDNVNKHCHKEILRWPELHLKHNNPERNEVINHKNAKSIYRNSTLHRTVIFGFRMTSVINETILETVQSMNHNNNCRVGPENLFNLNMIKLPIVCEKPSAQLFPPDVYKNAHLNRPYNDSIFNSLQFKMLSNRHRISGDLILTKNRL
ncbi:unnamed protein product [Trichobilharzia regenti]|nr:unnamed protein product [Trichobilharzia regenti]